MLITNYCIQLKVEIEFRWVFNKEKFLSKTMPRFLAFQAMQSLAAQRQHSNSNVGQRNTSINSRDQIEIQLQFEDIPKAPYSLNGDNGSANPQPQNNTIYVHNPIPYFPAQVGLQPSFEHGLGAPPERVANESTFNPWAINNAIYRQNTHLASHGQVESIPSFGFNQAFCSLNPQPQPLSAQDTQPVASDIVLPNPVSAQGTPTPQPPPVDSQGTPPAYHGQSTHLPWVGSAPAAPPALNQDFSLTNPQPHPVNSGPRKHPRLGVNETGPAPLFGPAPEAPTADAGSVNHKHQLLAVHEPIGLAIPHPHPVGVQVTGFVNPAAADSARGFNFQEYNELIKPITPSSVTNFNFTYSDFGIFDPSAPSSEFDVNLNPNLDSFNLSAADVSALGSGTDFNAEFDLATSNPSAPGSGTEFCSDSDTGLITPPTSDSLLASSQNGVHGPTPDVPLASTEYLVPAHAQPHPVGPPLPSPYLEFDNPSAPGSATPDLPDFSEWENMELETAEWLNMWEQGT
jgi:hypothetical protein